MIVYGTKYYEIVIEDKKNNLKMYHIGGDILSNTPTTHRGKSKVYYSLKGAKSGLRSVNKRLGDNMKAYINFFYANVDDF